MEKIRELRKKRGLTMRQAADALAIPYTTYVNYEKGLREPNSEKLLLLSEFFGVSVDELLGKDVPEGFLPLPRTRKIPLLGTIACGEPILAQQNIEEMIDQPQFVRADFALKCKGDSMINARIFDGDIVYIHQQPTVENGEIAAVIIDGEATLKRLYQYPNRLELRPENPLFPVLNFEGVEMNRVRVIGKAVAFLSRVW